VPTGWDEFADKVKRLLESGAQVDLHALWTEFLQRSQTSPRAQALQLLAKSVEKAPIDQRVSVAIVLTSLLAPVEWPPEWEQHRLRLVEALESLLSAMHPGEPGSLAAMLELKPEEDVFHVSGAFMLSCGVQLLRTPCRRDQLRPVAQLCDIGLEQLLIAYRRAISRKGGQSQQGPILEARMRFDADFDRYAQAARAFNSAVGEVLFERLDERLERSET
jgi:hypothetical protein